MQNGLSVRKVEELVSDSKPAKKESKQLVSYSEQQELLNQNLRLPVKISANKVVISFRNEEELNTIINRLI